MSWVAFGHECTTYAWDIAYGRPCIEVSSEGPQISAVPRPAPGSGGVVLFLPGRVYLHLLWFLLHRPASHRTEVVGGRAQELAYLGFRPADDLSVDSERRASLCRIALVGVHPNKAYATLEIRTS